MTNASLCLSYQQEHNVCVHTKGSMGEGVEFEDGVEKLLNKAGKPWIFITLTKQNTRKQVK